MNVNPTYEELQQRVEALEIAESERERAMSRVADAEKKSRAWLEHSPVCTKILDLQYNLKYMSTAGVRALRIEDISQYYGKPFPLDFYPELFRTSMTACLDRVKDTGKVETLEAPLADLAGNTLWFHSTLVPVNDDNGSIDYIIVVSVDVSDRRRAEEASNRNALLLQSVINASQDLVTVKDRDLRTVLCNSAFAQALGKTAPEELYGRTDIEIGWTPELPTINQKTDIGTSAPNDRTALEGSTIDIDCESVSCSNGVRQFNTVKSPVRDAEGKITGVLSVARDITDRKQQELYLKKMHAALEESEARLTLSADIANLGYAVWDEVNEIYLSMSDRYAAIHGFSKQDYIKKYSDIEKSLELIHPGDRELYYEYARGSEQYGDGSSIEYRIIRPDGELRYLHESYRFVLDENQQPTQSITSLQDITEQTLEQAAIAENEALLRQSAEMALLGYWEWNHQEEKMVSCSEQFAQLYEMSVEEAIAFFTTKQSDILVVHPDDRDRYSQYREECRKRGEAMDIEYRILTRSGRMRHIHLKQDLVVDAKGEIIRSFGLEQDITDLKEAEAELSKAYLDQKEFSDRFERAVDASGGFIYEADKTGHFTYLSDRFREVTGYEPQDQLGEFLSDLMPENDREQFEPELQHITDKQLNRRDIEVPITHSNGSIVWLSITCAPFYDANGAHIGFCGSGADITLRKLRDIELDDAMHKADAANRAKTNFLTAMSHEIRTPLNGVLGVSQLLQKTNLDKLQEEHVAAIFDSGQVLLELLNDILDISKIEENRIELEKTHFDLNDILRRCHQLWCPRLEEKNIELVIDNTINSEINLEGDPTRFYQILQNLLGNALKFTPDGKVLVRSSIEKETDSEIVLRVEVDDTGIGISEAGKAALFKRFSQVDSSVTRKYGGSGLGLNICRELVALMGGEIGVRSTPGQGSTFWFTAKLTKTDAAHHSVSAIQAAESNDLQIQFDPGSKVLVAEDNIVNQKVITAFLMTAGIKADIAENGLVAVEMASQRPYDLVLMDIQMPELDGLAATLKIQELSEHYKSTPIIAITANADKPSRNRYLTGGMTDYVPKPIDHISLLKVIAKYLPQLNLKESHSSRREIIDQTGRSRQKRAAGI